MNNNKLNVDQSNEDYNLKVSESKSENQNSRDNHHGKRNSHSRRNSHSKRNSVHLNTGKKLDTISHSFTGKKLIEYWIKDDYKNLKAQIKDSIVMKYFNQGKKAWLAKIKKEFDPNNLPIVVINERCNIDQGNFFLMNMTKQTESELLGEKLEIMLEFSIRNLHTAIVIELFQDKTNFETLDNIISRNSFVFNKQGTKIPVFYYVEFRTTLCDGVSQKYAVCQIEPLDADQKGGEQVFHPNNPYYLVWTIQMLILIIIISIATPFNLVYAIGDAGSEFELFADFNFLLDVCMNFNTGQLEEEDNVIVMERVKIVKNQLKGMFLFDLLSSIPFSLFEKYFTYGWFFKVFKVIRFFRLVKVSKVVRGLNIVKNFFKTEEGRWYWERIYENLGAFKLLEMLAQLFFLAHYYGCVFIFIEKNLQPPTWLSENVQRNHTLEWWLYKDPQVPQSVQMIEFIQLGLGQSSIKFQNETEFLVLLLWMLIGFGFFSLSIGNASQYILMENDEVVKFKHLMSTLDDLNLQQGLSDETMMTTKEAIKFNRRKLAQPDVRLLQPYLEQDVYKILLNDIYQDFINEHKFFEIVPHEIIIILEKNIQYHEISGKLQYINNPAEEIYFVLDGKVTTTTRSGEMLQEFEKNSIIGFDEFVAFQIYSMPHLKSKITNIQNNFARNSVNFDEDIALGSHHHKLSDQINKQQSLVNGTRSVVSIPDKRSSIQSGFADKKLSYQSVNSNRKNKKASKTTDSDFQMINELDGKTLEKVNLSINNEVEEESIETDSEEESHTETSLFKESDEEEEEAFIIQRKDNAKIDGISKIYSLHFNFMLECMREYPQYLSTFLTFIKDSVDNICIQDLKDTKVAMYKFEIDSEFPGLMLLSNGMVFRKNKLFMDYFKDHDLVGYIQYDQILRDDQSKVINNRFNNEWIYYTYEWYYYKLHIINHDCTILVKKQYKLGQNEIQVSEDEEDPGQQQDLSKQNVNIITFDKIEGPFLNISKIFEGETENIVLNKEKQKEGLLLTQDYQNGNCQNNMEFIDKYIGRVPGKDSVNFKSDDPKSDNQIAELDFTTDKSLAFRKLKKEQDELQTKQAMEVESRKNTNNNPEIITQTHYSIKKDSTQSSKKEIEIITTEIPQQAIENLNSNNDLNLKINKDVSQYNLNNSNSYNEEHNILDEIDINFNHFKMDNTVDILDNSKKIEYRTSPGKTIRLNNNNSREISDSKTSNIDKHKNSHEQY